MLVESCGKRSSGSSPTSSTSRGTGSASTPWTSPSWASTPPCRTGTRPGGRWPGGSATRPTTAGTGPAPAARSRPRCRPAGRRSASFPTRSPGGRSGIRSCRSSRSSTATARCSAGWSTCGTSLPSGATPDPRAAAPAHPAAGAHPARAGDGAGGAAAPGAQGGAPRRGGAGREPRRPGHAPGGPAPGQVRRDGAGAGGGAPRAAALRGHLERRRPAGPRPARPHRPRARRRHAGQAGADEQGDLRGPPHLRPGRWTSTAPTSGGSWARGGPRAACSRCSWSWSTPAPPWRRSGDQLVCPGPGARLPSPSAAVRQSEETHEPRRPSLPADPDRHPDRTNRFVINAMECCDSDEEGNPSERTYRRYRNLFEGGAGLIDLEAITVQWESRSRQHQLSVMPRNQKALERFVRELRKVNDKPLFVWQLTHSGELSHPGFSRRVCVKPLPGFGGDADRRGVRRQDHRAVRPGGQDRPRLRGGRHRLQELPRLPGFPAPAPLQRPQVEVRRPVGEPDAVHVHRVRAHRQGDPRSELPRGLQGIHLGGVPGRAGLRRPEIAGDGPDGIDRPREGDGGARREVHPRLRRQSLDHAGAVAARQEGTRRLLSTLHVPEARAGCLEARDRRSSGRPTRC